MTVQPDEIPVSYLEYLAQDWQGPKPFVDPASPDLVPEPSGTNFYGTMPQWRFVQEWFHRDLSTDFRFIAKTGLGEEAVTAHLMAVMWQVHMGMVGILPGLEALTWLVRQWVEDVYTNGQLWFASGQYLNTPNESVGGIETVVQLGE